MSDYYLHQSWQLWFRGGGFLILRSQWEWFIPQLKSSNNGFLIFNLSDSSQGELLVVLPGALFWVILRSLEPTPVASSLILQALNTVLYISLLKIIVSVSYNWTLTEIWPRNPIYTRYIPISYIYPDIYPKKTFWNLTKESYIYQIYTYILYISRYIP